MLHPTPLERCKPQFFVFFLPCGLDLHYFVCVFLWNLPGPVGVTEDPDLVRLPIGTSSDIFMLGLCVYQVGLWCQGKVKEININKPPAFGETTSIYDG